MTGRNLRLKCAFNPQQQISTRLTVQHTDCRSQTRQHRTPKVEKLHRPRYRGSYNASVELDVRLEGVLRPSDRGDADMICREVGSSDRLDLDRRGPLPGVRMLLAMASCPALGLASASVPKVVLLGGALGGTPAGEDP